MRREISRKGHFIIFFIINLFLQFVNIFLVGYAISSAYSHQTTESNVLFLYLLSVYFTLFCSNA